MAKENIPLGIKIISILYYVGALSYIIVGLATFKDAAYTNFAYEVSTTLGAIFSFQHYFLNFVGIFGFSYDVAIPLGIANILVGGGVTYLVGKNLWNGKNWAKIFAVASALLGVPYIFFTPFMLYIYKTNISGISKVGILQNLLFFVINLSISWFLIFNKEVKYFYKPSSEIK